MRLHDGRGSTVVEARKQKWKRKRERDGTNSQGQTPRADKASLQVRTTQERPEGGGEEGRKPGALLRPLPPSPVADAT